ncbi:DUF4287 domain-containing protein [candidate division KSB1 bacterium]|nr:DUF4287 domain-containing protein [candidate division KSB1 bacterium]
MTRPAEKSLYSVHPSVAYAQAIINNLSEKTGKSLDQWVRLLKKSGPQGEKERREWLKKEHQLGGTTASMIVARAAGQGAEDTDEHAYLKAAARYVEAMYTGPRAALRPLHDALLELGLSLADDVKICPCQTIVPFYRNHAFAQIKPTTRTRIDFGLALKGAKKKPPKRLTDTGGLAKGDRITHCFAITTLGDIDEEVRQWLKIAYELGG